LLASTGRSCWRSRGDRNPFGEKRLVFGWVFLSSWWRWTHSSWSERDWVAGMVRQEGSESTCFFRVGLGLSREPWSSSWRSWLKGDRQWIGALSEERVSCLVLRTKSLRLLWFAVLDEMILSTYWFGIVSLVADLMGLKSLLLQFRVHSWTLSPFCSVCARIFSKSRSRCSRFVDSTNLSKSLIIFSERFDYFEIALTRSARFQ
jgi:hypothetical protein